MIAWTINFASEAEERRLIDGLCEVFGYQETLTEIDRPTDGSPRQSRPNPERREDFARRIAVELLWQDVLSREAVNAAAAVAAPEPHGASIA